MKPKIKPRRADAKSEKKVDVEEVTIPIRRKPIKKEYIDFTREDQYYIPKAGPTYKPRNKQIVKTAKWGQRKLVLGVIQFFNHYWDPEEDPKPICLYVGAAEGYTIIMMSKLYPQIEWHLYDPRPFPKEVSDIPNVTIYPQLFEDADVEKWKDTPSLFFISDIRNRAYEVSNKGEEKWKNESVVINDMFMQEKWVYLINPKQALLKFRLPWIKGYYKENVGLFPYLQGVALYQSWLGPNSTEGRLVPTRNEEGNYHSVKWDCVAYENTLYYHNTFVRRDNLYKNPFGEGNVDGSELTGDWDSANETLIWRDYLNKADLGDNQENVIKLSRSLTNLLNKYLSYRTISSSRKEVDVIQDKGGNIRKAPKSNIEIIRSEGSEKSEGSEDIVLVPSDFSSSDSEDEE